MHMIIPMILVFLLWALFVKGRWILKRSVFTLFLICCSIFSTHTMNTETSPWMWSYLYWYWHLFYMHSCRLTCGWGIYCWNTVKIYTGWKDCFLSVECLNDSCFRFVLTNASILSCYFLILLQLWHLKHWNNWCV